MNSTFILRTSDLPTFANSPGANGSTNNFSASSFTWNDINIRLILGELWDKYEFFNICLVSTIFSATGTNYPSNDNKMGCIYLSGLDFTSNYDTGRKQRIPSVPIGYLNTSTISATAGAIQYYNSLFCNTFRKNSPITNINIFYTRISDNQPNTAQTVAFPQVLFVFKITPVTM